MSQEPNLSLKTVTQRVNEIKRRRPSLKKPSLPYCNTLVETIDIEELRYVLDTLDLALQYQDDKAWDFCLEFLHCTYHCVITINDSNQLIMEIHTNLIPFNQLEKHLIQPLFAIYEQHTGASTKKNQIKLYIEGDKSISSTELPEVTKRYAQQIVKLVFFQYKHLDDETLLKTIKSCHYLRILKFNMVSSVTENSLKELNKLPFLKNIEIDCCNGIKSITLSDFPALENLSIIRCGNLFDLSLHNMPNLRKLELNHCEKTEKIKFHKTNRIHHLSLKGCYNLKELVGIDNLNSLNTIVIDHCHNLKKIKIYNLEELETLHFEGLPYLSELILKKLNKLTTAMVVDCSVKTLSLIGISNLRTLTLDRCYSLGKINIKNAPFLETLRILFCRKLLKILGIRKLHHLRNLELYKNDHLSKLELKDLPCLEIVQIAFCFMLGTLKLHPLPCLKILRIQTCPELHKIPGFNKQREIEDIYLENNKKLKELKLKEMLLFENVTLRIKN